MEMEVKTANLQSLSQSVRTNASDASGTIHVTFFHFAAHIDINLIKERGSPIAGSPGSRAAV